MTSKRKPLVPVMKRLYVGFDGALGEVVISATRGEFPTWKVPEPPRNADTGIIIANKVPVFEALVASDHDYPMIADESGITNMHLICSVHSPGQVEVLKVLGSANEEAVHALDYLVRTPLHHALSPQNLKYHITSGGGSHLVELIKELINLGADVNALDIHDVSPLQLALNLDCGGQLMELPAVLRMLLDAGANTSHIVRTRIHTDGFFSSYGANNNVSPPPETSLMHLACIMWGPKSLDAMSLLITSDNVNCTDSFQRTLLHEVVSCIDEGEDLYPELHIEKLDLLLALGINVNATDAEGATPLCLAVQKVNFQISLAVISHLVNRGATGHVQFSDARITPLHYLCLKIPPNFDSILRQLRKAGGRINFPDIKGRTPLMYSLENSSCNVNILRRLCKAGAYVTVTDAEGLNCLHIVCRQRNPNPRLVKYLVKKGGCINWKNTHYGDTPLHSYLQRGRDQKFVEALITSGADVRIQNDKGASALHIVCESCPSDDDLVEMIVKSGADVNCTDCSNSTPLLLEVKKEDRVNMRTVGLLLRAGADPNIGDHAGSVPLHFASAQRDLSLMETLIMFGGNVNLGDLKGCTPLHRALRGAWSRCGTHQIRPVVEFLIKSGANINARDHANETPLLLAVQCHPKSARMGIVHLLLVAGADPNIVANTTPIHIAAFHGDSYLTKLLIDFGADVNIPDSLGDTPLHIGANTINGNPVTTVMVLINAGADLSLKNFQHQPPLAAMTCTYRLLIPYATILISAERLSLSEVEQNYFDSHTKLSSLFAICTKNAPLLNDIILGGTRYTVTQFLLAPSYLARRMIRNEEIVSALVSVLVTPSFEPFQCLIEERWTLLNRRNELEDECISSLSLVHNQELPRLVSERILSYLHDVDLESLSVLSNLVRQK